MIFLAPLFLIIAILFGINYFYYDKTEIKVEKNIKKIDKKELDEYIRKITND